jgi:hypothetical protein
VFLLASQQLLASRLPRLAVDDLVIRHRGSSYLLPPSYTGDDFRWEGQSLGWMRERERARRER